MNNEKNSILVGSQDYKYPRIRVEKDTYDRIAYLANESNATMNNITTALLNYALEHVETSEVMIPMTKLVLDGKEII